MLHVYENALTLQLRLVRHLCYVSSQLSAQTDSYI